MAAAFTDGEQECPPYSRDQIRPALYPNVGKFDDTIELMDMNDPNPYESPRNLIEPENRREGNEPERYVPIRIGVAVFLLIMGAIFLPLGGGTRSGPERVRLQDFDNVLWEFVPLLLMSFVIISLLVSAFRLKHANFAGKAFAAIFLFVYCYGVFVFVGQRF